MGQVKTKILDRFIQRELDMFSMCSLMHVKSIEGSKYCWALSTGVRECIWKMSAFYMVAHIAHGVIGELLTDEARWFASCSVSRHIHIEVLGLRNFTLNKNIQHQ